jgi:hypothetical protein
MRAFILLIAALFFVPAQAQEGPERGTGEFCDTVEQYVRYVDLRAGSTGPAAIEAVNQEFESSACGIRDILFYRGDVLGRTDDEKGWPLDITRILIVRINMGERGWVNADKPFVQITAFRRAGLGV